jgi:hypothetical protein
VQVSESNIIYCALGMLYKYTLLEGTKIINMWGSYHNFHLAHPIFIILYGIVEKTYQRNTKQKFKPRRAEILEI